MSRRRKSPALLILHAGYGHGTPNCVKRKKGRLNPDFLLSGGIFVTFYYYLAIFIDLSVGVLVLDQLYAVRSEKSLEALCDQKKA